MSNDELPTFTGTSEQIPSTILKLLGLSPPDDIPPPIEGISIDSVDQVVLVILDNFGLFEITMYNFRGITKIIFILNWVVNLDR